MNDDGLFPIAAGESLPTGYDQHTRARYAGEFRPPRSGEWYLSGAIVEAYRAPNDLSTPFHIATLVRGELVWQEKFDV